MGIDACIYVKTKDGKEPDLCDELPNGFAVFKAGEWGPDGATHEIDQSCRYYGPGYERGPWPLLAAALMALHAAHNVEAVWYFGDSTEGALPISKEKIIEISAHYMTEGDRPYRRR
jgi:hypothetical protein